MWLDARRGILMEMRVGYQLYSARELAEKDLEGVLCQLAAMGYEGVEFAGFYGHGPKEVRKLLKAAGLKAASSHVPLSTVQEDMEGVMDFHQAIGCSFLAIPYLDQTMRPGASGFASVLRLLYKFGRQCKKNGLTLLYHNHDFEFVELSGQAGLDFLFDAIPESLLKTEIDTCWVKYAGIDPVAYLSKYAGRAPVVHLKDFVGQKTDRPPYGLLGLPPVPDQGEGALEEVPFAYRPLGYGCQDLPALWQAAQAAGAQWAIVEQDESPDQDPLGDARKSIEALRKLRG